MTTEAKHAPEPWLPWADHPGDKDCPLPMGRDDYERARACVNACVGIPTEQLEEAVLSNLVGVLEEIEELRAEIPPKVHTWDAGRLRDALTIACDAATAAVAPFQKDSKS